jgi:hypothetical protein
MCVKLVLSTVLLAAVLGLACGDDNPAAPSPVPSPPPSTAPPPVPDVSNLLGVWNLMVRVSDVGGEGCIADTMRSQIGVPERYSLSITQNDKVEVTLRSSSGDYACTFRAVPDSDGNGFTTYGQSGTYKCEHLYLNFRCTDGTEHRIGSYGEDIAGHLSGSEMSGTWDAAWFEDDLFSGTVAEMKTEFTGTR